LKRLNASRLHRYPISISRIIKHFKKESKKKDVKSQAKIVVTVSTVTDDKRLLDLPKLTICALKFTESARKRILAAGGKLLTFD